MKHPRAGTCFLEVVKHRTAGSPQEEEVFWTHYTIKEIRSKMAEKGYAASRHDVLNLMRFFKYKRRTLLKTEEPAQVEDREEQFAKIAVLQEVFLENGYPVFSIDTKNKELIGNFYRAGTYFGTESQKVNDHDFPSFSDGKVIPHGIYDVGDNKGYLSLGTTKDTAEFVCHNFEYFWQKHLQWKYDDREWVLFLCDSGGSNNCRHYIFKEGLYKLAQRLQINIVVAHYPTYCSKYNPIERRLFCHIHRAWQGTVFKNIQIVKELAEKTSTDTGLSIEVTINNRNYTTERKYSEEFKTNINNYIVFDEKLPKWNYSVLYKPL